MKDEKLQIKLAELFQPEPLSQWLNTPNDAFGGSKPTDLIERGDTEELWKMIYYLESGTPS